MSAQLAPPPAWVDPDQAAEEWQGKYPLEPLPQRPRDHVYINNRLLMQVRDYLPERHRNAIEVVDRATQEAGAALDALHEHESRLFGAVRNESDAREAELILEGKPADERTILEQYVAQREQLHEEAAKALRAAFMIEAKFQSMLNEDEVLQTIRVQLDQERATALKHVDTLGKKLEGLDLYDAQDRSQAIQRAVYPQQTPAGQAGGRMRSQVLEHLNAIRDLLDQARV